MPLPKFVDICCGFSTSFAIDEDNSVWGWGGGNLGFKDVIIFLKIEIQRKRTYKANLRHGQQENLKNIRK